MNNQTNNGYYNQNAYQGAANGYYEQNAYQGAANGYYDQNAYQGAANGYYEQNAYQATANGYYEQNAYQATANDYYNQSVESTSFPEEKQKKKEKVKKERTMPLNPPKKDFGELWRNRRKELIIANLIHLAITIAFACNGMVQVGLVLWVILAWPTSVIVACTSKDSEGLMFSMTTDLFGALLGGFFAIDGSTLGFIIFFFSAFALIAKLAVVGVMVAIEGIIYPFTTIYYLVNYIKYKEYFA